MGEVTELGEYSVNCSILFTDLDLLDRPTAARAAGFDAVEFWWPFATSIPAPDEVDAFLRSLVKAGVQLTGLNFPAGDMAGGDRGLFSWPSRSAELRASFDAVTEIGEKTGCQCFNALYGNRVEGIARAVQDRLAVENLGRAAQAIERVGGTVLLEPLSGADRYPLKRSADAVAMLDRVATDHQTLNLGLLLDIYHLAVNGTDVRAEIDTYADRIAHVQVADAPGRGQPGTGRLPIGEWIEHVRAAGYTGPVGLEYRAGNDDPFAWLSRSSPPDLVRPASDRGCARRQP